MRFIRKLLAALLLAAPLAAQTPLRVESGGTGHNKFNVRKSVRVATTAAGTLSSSFENGDSVDGVTLATGDRILIKDQATGSENRIAIVPGAGTPSRATDADTSLEVTAGLLVCVEEGTANADKCFILTTNNPITLGTTALYDGAHVCRSRWWRLVVITQRFSTRRPRKRIRHRVTGSDHARHRPLDVGNDSFCKCSGHRRSDFHDKWDMEQAVRGGLGVRFVYGCGRIGRRWTWWLGRERGSWRYRRRRRSTTG
jgi:hypothetical protein